MALLAAAALTIGALAGGAVATYEPSPLPVDDRVAHQAFDVVAGQDPDELLRLHPPAGWRPPAPGTPLDDAVPLGWDDAVAGSDGARFSPFGFATNAGALCTAREQHPDRTGDIDGWIDALHTRLLDHTEVRGDARFVIYDFAHDYRRWTLEPGWVSAYGNARAIQGELLLHRCTRDARHLETAYALYRAFVHAVATPDRIVPTGEHRWLTSVGVDGLLWFEEAPLPGRRSPRILNGHNTAVLSLYYLHEWGGRDPDVRWMLEAGLTSVAALGERFRVPGGINRYDLLEPAVEDYGPERTVRQQEALHAITGAPVFDELARTFRRDVDAATGR